MPTEQFERAADQAIHDWLDARGVDQATLEQMARTYIEEAREVAEAAGWTWAPSHAVKTMADALASTYAVVGGEGLAKVIYLVAVDHVDWDSVAQPYIDRVLDAEEGDHPADVGVDAFGEPPAPKEKTGGCEHE